MRAVLPTLLLAATVACTPRYPCLSGSIRDPYRQREDLLLLQREYDRARETEPVVRARILEALPRLFPDLSHRTDAPECAPDLVNALQRELDQRPLSFSNATLHYLSALGNVSDTTDVMPRKAGILLRLAAIPDNAVRRYRRVESEHGAAPDAAFLRRRATAELVASNLYLNDARVRRLLVDKALASSDATEELRLFAKTQDLSWSPPDPRSRERLVGKWMRDVRLFLHRPAEPARFELLLSQLSVLSQLDEVAPQLRPILDRIVAADGALPITLGRSGWAHDLAVRARLALWDLDETDRSFGAGFADLPYANRDPVDVFRSLFEDPTNLVWSADRVAERLRQLDGELARIKDSQLRCWLLEQRAKWTPPPAQRVLFEQWLADESAPGCAFYQALEAETVPLATKSRIGIQAIKRAPYRPPSGPIVPRVSGALSAPDERAQTVRWLVAEHLSWISESEELRAALSADALGETPQRAWARHNSIDGLNEARVRSQYQRALHETVALDARQGDFRRERARKVVAHWIELLSAVDRKAFNNIYSGALYRALLFGVAELAPPLGLENEARPVLAAEELTEGGRDREIARWLFQRAGGR